MDKNCKWGIFPGKWGAKAKKRLPRRTKKRRQPAAKPQDGHQPRRIPLPPLRRAVPRGYDCPRGGRRAGSDTVRSQARFEGHSSVPKLGNDRTAFPEWTAGSGRETCLRVDSGHTPHAPLSGADFKTGCNDPKSSRYPTAELRIDGLSKMSDRCCCPKRCTCQGFTYLLANRDSAK